MTYLLDVNVLIALLEQSHIGHDKAHTWFEANAAGGWATCSTTQNGVLRIMGNPRFANTMGSPAQVVPKLQSLLEQPGHVFWTDDISLMTSDLVDRDQISTPNQVTDTYLLALAVHNRCALATFDRRMSTRAVKGAKSALHIIQARG